jgi:DNA recombination protein RmuC
MTTASAAALIVALLVGLVVGALVSGAVVGRRASRERLRATTLEGAVEALRIDNEALRRQQGDTRSLDDLLQPVRDGLESLRRAADSASRDRTEAEATLTTQITAVQERYQSLETATKQLAAALSRGQSRGQWGEMQLEGLLSHSGLIEGTHYRRQDTRAGVDGVSRPDIVVSLPGGGEILVDA